jgi:ribosome-binding protein aMBF1 (putative translation factor)
MAKKNFKTLHDRVMADPARAERVHALDAAIDTALALQELRRHRDLSQADVARALDESQANVSRIERQQDLYLSTLKHYIEAMGGELELTAVFPDERVELFV